MSGEISFDTVLFDLDGTLLDTITDLTLAVNYALRELGYPPRTEAEAKRFLGSGARLLVARSLPEQASEAEQERALVLFKAYYREHSEEHTAPYPGIMELLTRLKASGFRLAVISNKFDAAVKDLAKTWFSGVLDAAIGENEAEGRRRKPHPDAVFAAMRQLGSAPERCVYVGDSEVDLQTAQNAGIPGILCTWGFREREELLRFGADPARMIGAPEELLRVLENISEK